MSVSFLARDVVDWTGGDLLQGEETARFDGVSIDSRTVAPDQLFVAIQGPTHDGHLFVEGALLVGRRRAPGRTWPRAVRRREVCASGHRRR